MTQYLVAFDLETTGLTPDSADIIEVGGVKFTLGAKEAETFQSFANPGYPIPPHIADINGITSAMVAGAASPIEVTREFMDWVGSDSLLIVHNAKFDTRFVVAVYEENGLTPPPFQVVDTLPWARSLDLPVPDHKLGTLAAFFGFNTRGMHRALADASAVMGLTLRFADKYSDPLKELAARSRPLYDTRRPSRGSPSSAKSSFIAKAESNQKEQQSEMRATADERTADAQNALKALDMILADTLSVDDAIDWSLLMATADFPEPPPAKPEIPPKPPQPLIPPKPKRADPRYAVKLGVFGRLSEAKKKQRQEEAENHFLADHHEWETKARDTFARYERAKAVHGRELQRLREEYGAAVNLWKQRRADFLRESEKRNAEVGARKVQYLNGDASAVEDYCKMVLANSEYPDCLPRSYDVQYCPEEKLIIVDSQLPIPKDLPTLKEVKYVKTRDELIERELSQTQLNKNFASVAYQMALRTVHELFEADQAGALSSVVFNGFVAAVDKATGLDAQTCILSLEVAKAAFLSLDLRRVDPKECFEHLGGVAKPRLHTLSAVTPIRVISRVARE